MQQTLIERFHNVLSEPGQPPLYTFVSDDREEPATLTGPELDRRARAVAATLQKQSGSVGERALILYPPGLDYLTAFFGCIYAGVIAVPIYPLGGGAQARSLIPRLMGVAQDASPSVVLSPHGQADDVANFVPDLRGKQHIAVETVSNNEADGWHHPGVNSSDPAFLQYTSGSTGRPKGVVLSHTNLLANLSAIEETFIGHDTVSPRVTIWLPPYHDMGLIGGLLLPSYRGVPVNFMSPMTFLKRPAAWLQTISQSRSTISGGPNFAFDLCVSRVREEDCADLDLSCWEVAFSGAEPVRSQTLDRFAERFAPYGFQRRALFPCYGMAEASLLISAGKRSADPVTLRVEATDLEMHKIVPTSKAEGSRDLVGCGQVIPGHGLQIIDQSTSTPVPDGTVGEIWMNGPSVSRGFWERPELTSEQLHARLADGSGPFLRTGDLGAVQDGELYVTGRIKDLLIIAGRNHYPQDIENTSEQSHPGLRRGSGIAFSVDVEQAEQLIIVQSVRRKPSQEAAHEMCADIRAAVAAEHGLVVHSVVLVGPTAIPKTSSGKVQRSACKESYLDGSLAVIARDGVPAPGRDESVPATPKSLDPSPEAIVSTESSRVAMEQWLTLHLADHLQVSVATLAPDLPFASLGLQSADLVGLAGELERHLGETFAATLAWEYPTISSLAAYLTNSHDKETLKEEPSAASGEPVAIVGIGCRFPGGGEGPEAFWRVLSEGLDAVTEVPSDRWSSAEYYDEDPAAAGKTTSRWGGFINGIDRFDAAFFGISPREASRMDPQQRMLAEVAWDGLEDAGIAPTSLAGSPTGVFVGISTNDYGHLQYGRTTKIDAYTGTGNALSVAANRLSYLLDLRGPSMAVDTACSSSLVAVHQAYASLAQGDCEIALAGGVNAVLSPVLAINFAKAGAMARDGRCKTFDARADGYVRAEGAGVVVLKPLSAAQRDGDRVYAVIRGGAMNQDGRTNGLMAPNPQAQEAVLKSAYAKAAVAPNEVSYVELHGTGTLLGDPIEAKALSNAISVDRDPAQPCLVGSVKTNLGHLEAAAGIASLIKVALALHHRQIPASLHFQDANPHIPLEELALRVVSEPMEWPETVGANVAGVSSFGFGGTNAHMVLQEAPTTASDQIATEGPFLLPLSAATEQGLRELAGRYALKLDPDRVAQTCAASAVRRTHHDVRMACVARTGSEMRNALAAFARGEDRSEVLWDVPATGRYPKVAFVFSGQGSQWWPIDRELVDGRSPFADTLRRCAEILERHTDWSLLDQLTGTAAHSLLDDPGVVQPVTCALQVALAAQWQSWGVEPTAAVGHSLGEVAAAHVSGSLDLETAIEVALHRGQVIRQVIGKGRMAVVGLGREETEQRLDRDTKGLISVAASNGPVSTVISGDTKALQELSTSLDTEGIFCQVLETVDYPSHSPQMAPLQEELIQRLVAIQPRETNRTMMSTVTAQPMDGAKLNADYWAANLRRPVLFAQATEALLDAEYDTFIEISGHPSLLGAVSDPIEDREQSGTVVGSLDRDLPSWEALLRGLGWLYCSGYPVDWTRLHGSTPPMVPLPTYPWQRERHWLDEGPETDPQHQANVAPSTQRSSSDQAFWDAVDNGDLKVLERTLALEDPEKRTALAKVLPTLAAWNRTASNGAQADSWRYRVTWEQVDDLSTNHIVGTWLIVRSGLPAQKDLADLVASTLTALGCHTVDCVLPADSDRASIATQLDTLGAAQKDVQRVVCLLALDDAPTASHPGLANGPTAVLALAQALDDLSATAVLHLLTSGAVTTGRGDPLSSPAQAMTTGLARVMGLEHPTRWGGLIDIGDIDDPGLGDLLGKALRAAPDEDELAVRNSGLYARRLVRVAADQAPNAAYRPQGTVLLTGGTGALGKQVALWLAKCGVTDLVIVSRRGPAADGAAELHAELAQLGVNTTIQACDVADRAALIDLLEALKTQGRTLSAVFHVAGDVSLLRPLVETTTEDLKRVAAGKTDGAWNLHDLLPKTLDTFVLFSSITGVWGSANQSAYSAANAYLDGLAEYRHGQGLAATSIQWGPWGGPAHDAHIDELTRRGLRLLDPRPALSALETAIGSDHSTVLVADMDWSLFAPAYASARPRPLLRSIPEAQRAMLPEETIPPAADTGAATLREELLAVEPGRRRRALLIERCVEETAHVLQLDPERVELTTPFSSMGFDSLMALDLKKRLEVAVGTTLPSTLAWRHPTVEALTPFLAERIGVDLDRPVESKTPDPGPRAAHRISLGADVSFPDRPDADELTEDEVEVLLMQRLATIENSADARERN